MTATVNPDATVTTIKVHSGPFFWLPVSLGKYKLEMYAGFRPTPVWKLGMGNEGIIPAFKRLMMKLGMSNLGFAFRIKKVGGVS